MKIFVKEKLGIHFTSLSKALLMKRSQTLQCIWGLARYTHRHVHMASE